MYNYKIGANKDDGSCIPFVLRCMDTKAINYNINAQKQDGSCKKEELSYKEVSKPLCCMTYNITKFYNRKNICSNLIKTYASNNKGIESFDGILMK